MNKWRLAQRFVVLKFSTCGVLILNPRSRERRHRHTLRMIRTIAVCISTLHKRGVRYYGAIIIRACCDILCTRGAGSELSNSFTFYGTIFNAFLD